MLGPDDYEENGNRIRAGNRYPQQNGSAPLAARLPLPFMAHGLVPIKLITAAAIEGAADEGFRALGLATQDPL